MACPFFAPAGRNPDRPAWACAPRLPLGEECAGTCRAGEVAWTPDAQLLASCCNRGYGRGECPRFPADAEADALRFSLEADEGGVLRIVYVYERDYGPVRHGRLEYDQRSGECAGGPADEAGKAQARIFAGNYLQRRKV